MVTARSRPKPLLQIVPVDRLEATTGGEGLTARLKALALAYARVARPPGRAAHRARRASAARFEPGSNPQTPLSILKNPRSEEHTSELQSRGHLVCSPLLEQ